MPKLSVSQARIPPDTFNRVVYQGERVRVERRDGAAVVIVSQEDAALLEALEDKLDIEAAREAIRDMKAKGEKPIPWAQVKKELGL